ncbi:hypothetical protein BP5796_09059 [Coleophoma crateriformis]|uniref:Uncharacterized protein n=1 Tax=Coleophoma crateriformis TaxID=565419 RepID=A0A3D8R2Y0_9HELO|nr:hypothetical protein BP5796_09059 [Coleophoma crateriformis]
MARLSTGAVTPPPISINLSRMISRLHDALIKPDPATESLLRRSSYEREKVAENIEYARNLLVRCEQDALNIRVQTRKQETQTDLLKKRQAIERFAERLDELNEAAQIEEENGSSEGEDLLGEDTPSETDDQTSQSDQPLSNSLYDNGDPVPQVEQEIEEPVPIEEPAGLRSRFPQSQAQQAQDTGMSTATTEALLTHNRTEQEAITASMLTMAKQLKEHTYGFAASLEDEKEILQNTTATLDRNESGMEAAQKRMGYRDRIRLPEAKILIPENWGM